MLHLSLDYFNLPPERNYHIYGISSSKPAEVPHSHSYFQICYVDKGEIEHWSDNEPIQLSCGDVFIVPPNFIHKIVFPNSNAYIYSLAFSADMFSPGFVYSNAHHFLTMLRLDSTDRQRLATKMRISLDGQQRPIVKHLFEALIKLSSCDHLPEFSAAQGIVSSMIYIIAQAYFSDKQNNINYAKMIARNEAITKCIEYIDKHFTEPLILSDLAKQFAFSETSFSLLFPVYTGVTLKRYIARKRINNAIILISNTNMSINSIARLVGYEEFSTFYRNFMNQTGKSPSSYQTK